MAAFGTSFDRLAVEGLGSRLALPPAGPQLPAGAVPKTATLLVLATAVGALGLRRRQTA